MIRKVDKWRALADAPIPGKAEWDAKRIDDAVKLAYAHVLRLQNALRSAADTLDDQLRPEPVSRNWHRHTESVVVAFIVFAVARPDWTLAEAAPNVVATGIAMALLRFAWNVGRKAFARQP